MSNQRIDLIRQALGASESSIKLAKQLLTELETGQSIPSKQLENDRPGVIGIYDGEKMVSEKGDTFPIPANYASKSLLVVGDTLKLYEENGEKRFKQIEHVKRHKSIGILVKKEGKFRAITPEGSYKVLPEAVAHFKGDVGDEVVLHLPAGNMTSPYGAIESLTKKTKSESEPEVEKEVVKKTEPTKKEDPKPEKVETAPVKEEKPEIKEEVKVEKQPEVTVEKAPEPKAAIEKKPEPKPEAIKNEAKPEPAATPEKVEAPKPVVPIAEIKTPLEEIDEELS